MPTSLLDHLARALAAGVHRRQVLGGLIAALAVRRTHAVKAQAATPAAGRAPTWLYVQAFAAAVLAPDRATAGEYTLTLSGLDEAVLGFTERPDRQVMTLPTVSFTTMAADQSANPLNATLVAPRADGEAALMVVELLSADDVAAGTVRYRVGVLEEAEGAVRAAATPLAAPAGTQRFGAGYLFVDGCGQGCNQCQGMVNEQCTD